MESGSTAATRVRPVSSQPVSKALSMKTEERVPERVPERVQEQQPIPAHKIVITGDDILIEYVNRIVSQLRTLDEDFLDEQELSTKVRIGIQKFVSHHVWQKAVGQGKKLWA